MPDPTDHKKLRVFISYSHRDSRWMKELQTHLAPYVDDESVDAWADDRIPVGGDWKAEIDRAMDEADLGILLVSPDFLQSRFIRNNELPKLLAKSCVYCVAVRYASIDRTALARLQFVNNPNRPIAEIEPRAKRDRVWVAICKMLLQQEIRSKSESTNVSTDSPAGQTPPATAAAPIPTAVIQTRTTDPTTPVVCCSTHHQTPHLATIQGSSHPIGSNKINDETPAHYVNLAAFRIAVYPVTNGDFAQFLAAGGYEDETWWATPAAHKWLASAHAKGEAKPAYWDEATFNDPAQPVVGVCWHEARAYCSWLSAQTGTLFRLPTEAEWEAAARGVQGREYPWGDIFDQYRCNTWEAHLGHPSKVGSYANATPEGVYDLSGNVWEWTSTLFRRYPYRADDRRDSESTSGPRVLRGGSWNGNSLNARSAYRYSDDPGVHNGGGFGFRLASPALDV